MTKRDPVTNLSSAAHDSDGGPWPRGTAVRVDAADLRTVLSEHAAMREALEHLVGPNLELRDPDEVNWALVAAALKRTKRGTQ